MHEMIFHIPAGVTITKEGDLMTVKGAKGSLERIMHHPAIDIITEDGVVKITTESPRRRVYALVGTYNALLHVMAKGVTEGYEYHMKIVYNHFPIQVKVAGDRVEIANFLGEKQARYAKIVEGVKVKVQGDEVILNGIDREKIGNTAANVEQACKVRNRDPRVFQDGIYITNRGN
ncbi:50S ribosomal protein L6 [Methanocorpusculaceae archaeon Sp1]|uniref:Large ribosomal subunit protein uL6 n=1 Tax=Methanorbis furvi TaxID=3028299 RepID=A0AAE4MDM0_9EURY|nr:50S ribosomal protein L6 [Methanocorpusculaceae archaeon Sp1]MDV0442017.1 50S ribosomal protein L6 [Methanocorpusculaceae archaeon Ag1]